MILNNNNIGIRIANLTIEMNHYLKALGKLVSILNKYSGNFKKEAWSPSRHYEEPQLISGVFAPVTLGG